MAEGFIRVIDETLLHSNSSVFGKLGGAEDLHYPLNKTWRQADLWLHGLRSLLGDLDEILGKKFA